MAHYLCAMSLLQKCQGSGPGLPHMGSVGATAPTYSMASFFKMTFAGSSQFFGVWGVRYQATHYQRRKIIFKAEMPRKLAVCHQCQFRKATNPACFSATYGFANLF